MKIKKFSHRLRHDFLFVLRVILLIPCVPFIILVHLISLIDED